MIKGMISVDVHLRVSVSTDNIHRAAGGRICLGFWDRATSPSIKREKERNRSEGDACESDRARLKYKTECSISLKYSS